MKPIIQFLSIYLLSNNILAFQVSPIEISFEPKGINSVQTVTLENSEKESVPIEINVFERRHVNGQEVRVPTKDFSFFPTRLVLKSNEKRSIRISWMGERDSIDPKKLEKNQFLVEGNRNLKQEKAYRLEVRQVPVNIKRKKKKTGFDFIYNYVASLYVAPVDAKAKIVVKSTKRISRNEMTAQIQNLGTSHAILAEYKVIASMVGVGNNPDTDLGRQAEEVRGVNLLPNETRTIKLQLPENTPSKNLELKFKKI